MNIQELRPCILGVYVTQEFHCSKLVEAIELKYELLKSPVAGKRVFQSPKYILVTWNRLGQKCRGSFHDV